MSYKICEDVLLLKKNYDDPIDIVDGLPFKQSDRIRTVEFYSNSKYMGKNGQKDERGNRRAFFQIINGMCDVEDAAVDVDTKDVQVTADDRDGNTIATLITKDVYQWMKDADFGKTLNDMKKTRTKYGSLLVKKCIEKDEDSGRVLEIEIPEWKNLITDQVDIMNNPIVEVHYMTPLELRKKAGTWDKDLINDIVTKARKAGAGKRIAVYEVRGEFPRSYIKQVAGEDYNEDDNDFSYQLYYLAGGVESKKEQKLEDLKPLYWEDDTEKVYKYLSRKKRAGRDFGVGVFEEGEEAQIMTNDAILKQNRAMAYTSKVVGQSASKKLKGRNMLDEVDDGQILEHEDGKPITPLNLLPSGGLAQYQELLTQWYTQFERVTSAYSAQRGETPPSGTPFRLQATVLQQSSSVFQDLQEEFGIFITEIMEDWVLPFLSTQLNKEHVLAWDFTPEELLWIDRNFSTREANRQKIEALLNGKIPTEEEQLAYFQKADEYIKQTGGKRFITILKDEYKKANKKVTYNITGEQRNKAAVMESLNSILMTYAKFPNAATDPVLSQILMKLIEVSGAGISPISIMSALEEAKKQAIANPQPAQPTAQPSPMSLQANPVPNVA